eukprot:jgi/Mesen1/3623/ME000020S03155
MGENHEKEVNETRGTRWASYVAVAIIGAAAGNKQQARKSWGYSEEWQKARDWEQKMREEAERDWQRNRQWHRIHVQEQWERDQLNKSYARWRQQWQQQYDKEWSWDGKPRQAYERASNFDKDPGPGSGSSSASRPGRSQRGAAEHWQALGLDRLRPEPFTSEEIKAAYRAKAMEHHPDKNPDNPEAAASKFRRVQRAYQALTGEGHMELSRGADFWQKLPRQDPQQPCLSSPHQSRRQRNLLLSLVCCVCSCLYGPDGAGDFPQDSSCCHGLTARPILSQAGSSMGNEDTAVTSRGAGGRVICRSKDALSACLHLVDITM